MHYKFPVLTAVDIEIVSQRTGAAANRTIRFEIGQQLFIFLDFWKTQIIVMVLLRSSRPCWIYRTSLPLVATISVDDFFRKSPFQHVDEWQLINIFLHSREYL